LLCSFIYLFFLFLLLLLFAAVAAAAAAAAAATAPIFSFSDLPLVIGGALVFSFFFLSAFGCETAHAQAQKRHTHTLAPSSYTHTAIVTHAHKQTKASHICIEKYAREYVSEKGTGTHNKRREEKSVSFFSSSSSSCVHHYYSMKKCIHPIQKRPTIASPLI